MKLRSLFVMTLILCVAFRPAFAQTMPEDWIESMIPVQEEKDIFRIGTSGYNHQFRVALPEGNTLVIDFLRLSDWGTEHRLGEVAAVAAAQYTQLRDSFRSPQATSVMELNLPADKQTIAVRCREHPPAGTQMIRKDNEYYHLKTGMDTLRVVEHMGVRTYPWFDSGIVRVQYTFILKNLSDIEKYAQTPGLLQQAGNRIDSVVQAQRQRWKRQDLRYHELRISYDPLQEDLAVHNGNSLLPFMGKTFSMYLGFGATLFKSTLGPRAEMTMAYIFPDKGKQKPFVGLTMSSFYLYRPDGTLNRAYGALDAEFGVCSLNGLMRKKTSVGIGYRYSAPQSRYSTPMPREEFGHFFMNYGVSQLFTVGWDVNFNIRKKDDVLFGVHIMFNL